MSERQPGRLTTEQVGRKLKETVLPVAILLALTTGGCGSSSLSITLPPCEEDPQPKSITTLADSVTIGNIVIITNGREPGKLDLHAIRDASNSIILKPKAVEGGIIFDDPVSKRRVHVVGEGKTDLLNVTTYTKKIIDSTCEEY